MSILNDLDLLESQLTNYENKSAEEIKCWRKEIVEKLNILNLKKNPGIIMLLDGINNKIENIDNQLKEIEIGTEKAKYIYHEKIAYKWLLSFFEDVEKSLENKEIEIRNNLQ